LKRRGILLTQFAEQVPPSLPAGVRHFAYVPFSRLLPRAAALIHHGGIGTTAQGLRAGIPHLVMPMAHDQPDNAARLKRLGVGDWLKPAAFRGPAVAARLQRLLTDDTIPPACREVAARFHGVDPAAEACRVIENHGHLLKNRSGVAPN
jgi:UDP:flavonoid glycosyltransferase YjiC (YdhE family)